MWTVSEFAHRHGLSRGTLLYYESVGLLRPPPRTPGNYRQYGAEDAARLREILAYRAVGVRLADIRALLAHSANDATLVLKRRLLEIDGEVARLRSHQQAILKLLAKTETLRRYKVMTKDKWVSIMKAAGFSEDDMRRWHAEFERAAGGDHQEFLQYLHIPDDEIRTIREWSARGGPSR